MSRALQVEPVGPDAPSGKFIDMFGERYYAIENVDRMPPFFISVVSSHDHWLFVSLIARDESTS
jgi:hypothetical protein